MKLWKAIFFALIFSLLPAYSYSSTLGDLRISFLDGDVQVKTGETPEWIPASINMPLLDGDSVWVPEGGRVEINLRDGTYMRLDQNSSLDILRIEKASFQFYLSTGHAYVNFKGLRGSLVQMDTPLSSVRAYERSVFRIDVFDNGYTDISVFKGIVYAEGRSGKTRVNAGKILSLREDTYAELSPLGPLDDWERWNREMDRKLERRYGSRYLPDDLNAYSYDFDEYGKWVYVRDYGYCWTPTVISVGWAPYRHGRWTWIGGDYVWVSYEPWGWAPYHYGRWAFVASSGWCWVPPVRGAVYWGPGYVGWVHTPTYVSWVPLAPGEIYYGYGYYGPHSVNIINININNVRITNVYKNVYVNNAVTVVNHDAFIKGRSVDVRIKENPFLTQRISVGRPLINPVRETRMPIIKEIPSIKQPPQAIRQIQVRELKESRPVVKNPAQSVLRPGATLKEMSVKSVKEPRQPGTVMQPQGLQPRTTGREIQRPSRETRGREIQRPSGEAKGREIQRPSGGTTGREIQRPSGSVAPRETGKQGVQQRRGTEAEKEQVREPGMGR